MQAAGAGNGEGGPLHAFRRAAEWVTRDKVRMADAAQRAMSKRLRVRALQTLEQATPPPRSCLGEGCDSSIVWQWRGGGVRPALILTPGAAGALLWWGRWPGSGAVPEPYQVVLAPALLFDGLQKLGAGKFHDALLPQGWHTLPALCPLRR